MQPGTGPQTTESYPAQTTNYQFIVNELIQNALRSRVNNRTAYKVWVDDIELSISFVLGTGQNAPDALKKINKKIGKIHTEFETKTQGKDDKKINGEKNQRDQELFEQYDIKFQLLLEKYNEWVQLFRKPIKRSKAALWTGP